MQPQQYQRLSRLLSQPTAPFREYHVMRTVEAQLKSDAIPFFYDPCGNIVVGVSSQLHLQRLLKQKTTEPLRLYIAHMDHPGFHATRWLDNRTLAVKWYGGAPLKHLHNSRMWLANKECEIGFGRLRKAVLTPSGLTIESAQVRLDTTIKRKDFRKASDLFGGFAFQAPVWEEQAHIHTRAIDDLAAVHVILELARAHFRKKKRSDETPFIGLLTRGEEVGFIGAVGHFDLDWYRTAKRHVVCISLEASRTLPGAVIGKGPIVRLGDRRTVFSAGPLHVLTSLADKRLKGRYQRRIMDGGACEATVTTAYGFPTLGIALPLGNYHNQGFEGGTGCRGVAGPAPEFVHREDLAGMLTLCKGLLRPGLPWDDPWHTQRQIMQRRLAKHRRLLD